jgi:hypothetical protein
MTFAGRIDGRLRATATTASMPGSAANELTRQLPTFPVAPQTTTRITFEFPQRRAHKPAPGVPTVRAERPTRTGDARTDWWAADHDVTRTVLVALKPSPHAPNGTTPQKERGASNHWR